jgi:hypothetical protein
MARNLKGRIRRLRLDERNEAAATGAYGLKPARAGKRRVEVNLRNQFGININARNFLG